MARFEMMSKQEQEGVLTLLNTSEISSLAIAVEILDIWQVGNIIYDQFSKAKPIVRYWKCKNMGADWHEISCEVYHFKVADFKSYNLNEEKYFYTITWEYGPIKLMRYYYPPALAKFISYGRSRIYMSYNMGLGTMHSFKRNAKIYHLSILGKNVQYGTIEGIKKYLSPRRIVTSIGDAIIDLEEQIK